MYSERRQSSLQVIVRVLLSLMKTIDAHGLKSASLIGKQKSWEMNAQRMHQATTRTLASGKQT